MFTNIYYFPVLVGLALIYWLLPKQSLRNGLLTLASLSIIYYLDHKAIIVVVAMSFFTYFAGKFAVKKIKGALPLSLTVLILVLMLFKYLGLLTNTYNSFARFVGFLPGFHLEALLLPLGLSYLVFKQLSYLIDLNWGLVKAGSFLSILNYSSLFTIYVAGPIERYETYAPQLEEKKEFSWALLDNSFMRIVFGLFKKLVLADWLGYFVNPVWQNQSDYSLGTKILALCGYSLQIYFDFAGYSDIAIGSSRLFGLKIGENFHYPYFSQNISQFWQRWHISLSDWIRSYLFFPLNQVFSGKFWQVFLVPVIAMGLCGLWHGAAWHFALWGVWHGVGISIYQMFGQYKRKRKNFARALKKPVYKYLGMLLTFVYVTVGWLWFM